MERKILVGDLISSMKEAFLSIKNIKNSLLKAYVHRCATKIQKVFKGYYCRHIIVQIKRIFKRKEEKLKAVV
jgi:hypothetical protein